MGKYEPILIFNDKKWRHSSAITFIYLYLVALGMRGSRGGQGVLTPWKITKIKVFLAILVLIHWIITKLPSQHSMLGHHWHASETPFKRCFAGGPLMARFYLYFGPFLKKEQQKTKQKKTLLKLLDPSEKTFWIYACSARPFWVQNGPAFSKDKKKITSTFCTV